MYSNGFCHATGNGFGGYIFFSFISVIFVTFRMVFEYSVLSKPITILIMISIIIIAAYTTIFLLIL